MINPETNPNFFDLTNMTQEEMENFAEYYNQKEDME